jgi:hypothetical protein
MSARVWVLALLRGVSAFAQTRSSHKPVSLDAVFAEWDGVTKSCAPGMSVMQPQKIRFDAKYLAHPVPCSNRALEIIFNTLSMPGVLKQVAVTQCIKLASPSGKELFAWVQDVLVPGFNADAQPGGQINFYADLLAYGVGSDRTRNMPFMLISRFEPK